MGHVSTLWVLAVNVINGYSSWIRNWSYIATYLVVLLVVATLFKKARVSIVSKTTGMKFARIVLQVNTHRLIWRSQIFDVTMTSMSYFQYGGHNLHPPLTAAYAAASAGLPLARRARVTSMAHCMRYRSWSIVHSYRLYLFNRPGSMLGALLIVHGPVRPFSLRRLEVDSRSGAQKRRIVSFVDGVYIAVVSCTVQPSHDVINQHFHAIATQPTMHARYRHTSILWSSTISCLRHDNRHCNVKNYACDI